MSLVLKFLSLFVYKVHLILSKNLDASLGRQRLLFHPVEVCFVGFLLIAEYVFIIALLLFAPLGIISFFRLLGETLLLLGIVLFCGPQNFHLLLEEAFPGFTGEEFAGNPVSMN